MTSTSTHGTGTDKLLVDVDDGIALVTFNNPEKRNALSVEVRTALPGALTALQADPEVRVVVLTGAPGSGKSSTARALAAEWHAAVLDQDAMTNPLVDVVSTLLTLFLVTVEETKPVSSEMPTGVEVVD